MKKKELITLGAIIAIIFTACYNPFFPAKRDSGADPEAPHISSHPQSAIYTINKEAVDLTVTASVGDGGTLSYQWYSNASNSNEGGTAIAGKTDKSYTPPTNTDSIVYYYVTVTNSLNGKTTAEASHTARIEVNDKVNAEYPRISVQPQGAEYAIGDAATALTIIASIASVSDGGALSYQWYRNTLDSNEGGTPISGATGVSYTPPTNQLGTVYYYVSVTNTIDDNGDGGNKSAIMVSNTASITVVDRAEWVRTVSAGSDESQFRALAVDASGNVYAAGSQSNTGTYTYGSGVNATGINEYKNVVLVKYNSGGTAQWARTVSAGSSDSTFRAVAVDSSGNVYAAGSGGGGTFTYGNGVSATGSYSLGNVVLVKYDSGGTAQWARSVIVGGNSSAFNAVAVDASGNVYAAGQQYGNGFNYGNNVIATGGAIGSNNAVLVKYNSGGTAQWARIANLETPNSLFSQDSYFYAVAVDASGNVYAAGQQRGTITFTYGGGVSATGTYSGSNVVLVKYDSSGIAQWARTVSAGSSTSMFNAVAVDASGNVYAAGYQNGTGVYTYGSGVSVTGAYNNDSNVVLVKYDSGGTAQWARTVSAGGNLSRFNAVAVDASGNVYAAGHQKGVGAYTYGNGVSATGIFSVTGVNGGNVVLVKYNSSGIAQWARTVSSGSNSSMFSAVAADASGYVYAAGHQKGIGAYTYGSGVNATGTSATGADDNITIEIGGNVVLVKYRQ